MDKKKYIKVPVNTTYKQYLYGDFDKDKVKNIDDPAPFNKNVSKWPKTQSSAYHNVQYGGGDVKFSEVLLKIEKHNQSFSPLLKRVVHENKGSYGRIKTVPSTINKLYDRNINSMHDVAGATVTTHNRKQAYNKSEQIKRNYKYKPELTNDYYKNPKNGYYAIHHGLVAGKNKTVELQIKSKTMERIQIVGHKYYKKDGHWPTWLIKKAERKYKQGY